MTLLLPGRRVLRTGPASAAVRPRTIAVCLVAVAATAVLGVLAIGLGTYQLSPGEVVEVLLGGGTRVQHQVVVNLRLPRVLAGIGVGVALGLAGALTQSVARNPLASPDLLGFTDGAAAGAVTLIVLGRPGGPLAGEATRGNVSLAALAGALAAGVLVHLLAWRRGVDRLRLILVGVMVAEVLSGVVSWMLVRADLTAANQAVLWLTGSLQGRSWDQVGPMAVALAVLLPLTAATAFSLGGLQFGPDTGRALGLRLGRAQLGVVLTAIGLVAVAVATAGPIAFVAFVVPQVALRLCGGGRPPLAASALLGGLLVVAADLTGRLLPGELPVGVITAVLGAPYLLWLLLRLNRRVS